MNLPHSEQLNIGSFSRLFDNTSNCYKFFWFKAIMTKLEAGRDTFTFDELVNEMIADAWYMVTEYHLRLGPNGTTDNLEDVVKYIGSQARFKSSEKRSIILDYLAETEDKQVLKHKRDLILNVPYRLQVPFYDSITIGRKDWSGDKSALTSIINQQDRMMYYFMSAQGLNSIIRVEPMWQEYLLRNREIIHGWLELNLIHYLQRRNPSVPGIADKLSPPQERKLEKVKKYWKAIISMSEVRNIYTGERMGVNDVSIDHFVPWSYVAHDELWNLAPTTKSVNSSKSNNLPAWDVYFPRLAKVEYQANKLILDNPQINELSKAASSCMREHVNSDEIRYKLYDASLDEQQFRAYLETIVRPAYESARNNGFGVWSYG